MAEPRPGSGAGHGAAADPVGDDLVVSVVVPLEPSLVDRIAAVPGVSVRYEQDLLPVARFAGDHRGTPVDHDDAMAARWSALLDGADVVYGIPGDTPDGLADLVRRAPRLRWVQATAAGAGEQARRAGLTADDLARVAVTTAAGVHGTSLAEFAVFGLLAGAKDLDRLAQQQSGHEWPQRWPMRQLAGRRLLVVGLGGIGTEVARIASALGMHVTGVRRRAEGERPAYVDRVLSLDRLVDAVTANDDVVLALPGTAETAGVVGDDVLAACSADTTLVNVGRGTAVDEAALLAALDAGRPRFAVLDVTAQEPLPADSPLWDHPKVLLSPHTAALTTSEDDRIVELFVDNLHRLRDGRPLRNRVDPHHYY